jgi:hypothetical protein
LLFNGDWLYLSFGITNHVWLKRSADCGESWLDVGELDLPTSSGYTGLASLNNDLAVFVDTDQESTIKGFPVMHNR